jgi:hypothetical protein
MKGNFEKGKNTITNEKKRDPILQYYMQTIGRK